MAKKQQEAPIVRNETILQRPMEDIIHMSMIPYAEYVILDRALPRVEDGLKPVQRRILYTMYELGLSPDKPHRKCARIVGDALGKYHPHGDTSVYDALVRMAQDFNLRAPLVEGHGNFGSIDGDTAAAMRYTEARLSPMATEMLRDIEKDTVPFSLNFDDTLKEPDLLPARFPNLLVNGASGIAVGLATNIPPHNLGEVIDGVIAQMSNPAISLDELMTYVKGPDFPTGGFILQSDEIRAAYETGRGRITVRAKTHIENMANGKSQIVITEMPYQTNKAALLEKIVKIREDKKGVLSGITDIRDESDRTGMRAVIEVKRDVDAELVLEYLFKYSGLQTNFGVNLVAIAEGRPMLMGLIEVNRYYIAHQREIVIKRTQFELTHLLEREHILDGLMIALANIDEVIRIIRASKTPKDAREALMKRFVLSERQAQAILDMRLQRLTNLEMINLKNESAQVKKEITRCREILGSESVLFTVIRDELLDIRQRYTNARRTAIIDIKEKTLPAPEELQAPEEMSVMLSGAGYIRRISLKAFQRSAGTEENSDTMVALLTMMSNEKLLVFTSVGNGYQIDCKDIPEVKRKEKGALIQNLAGGFAKDETVVAMIPLGKEQSEDTLLYAFTKGGMVKASRLGDYLIRNSKMKAIGLREGDALVNMELQRKDNGLLLVTKAGMSIHIGTDQVPATGRATGGVKGIALSEGDHVVFAGQIGTEGEMVLISDKGYAKRSFVFDYERQNRNGKGLKTFDFKKNGANGSACLAAFYVKEPFTICCEQKSGEVTMINTEEIGIEDRFSKGKPAVMVLLGNEIIRCMRVYHV